MFNDVTALVLCSVAVLLVVTGELTVVSVGLDLVIAVAGGVVLSLSAGERTRQALDAVATGGPPTPTTRRQTRRQSRGP